MPEELYQTVTIMSFPWVSYYDMYSYCACLRCHTVMVCGDFSVCSADTVTGLHQCFHWSLAQSLCCVVLLCCVRRANGIVFGEFHWSVVVEWWAWHTRQEHDSKHYHNCKSEKLVSLREVVYTSIARKEKMKWCGHNRPSQSLTAGGPRRWKWQYRFAWV